MEGENISCIQQADAPVPPVQAKVQEEIRIPAPTNEEAATQPDEPDVQEEFQKFDEPTTDSKIIDDPYEKLIDRINSRFDDLERKLDDYSKNLVMLIDKLTKDIREKLHQMPSEREINSVRRRHYRKRAPKLPNLKSPPEVLSNGPPEEEADGTGGDTHVARSFKSGRVSNRIELKRKNGETSSYKLTREYRPRKKCAKEEVDEKSLPVVHQPSGLFIRTIPDLEAALAKYEKCIDDLKDIPDSPEMDRAQKTYNSLKNISILFNLNIAAQKE